MLIDYVRFGNKLGKTFISNNRNKNPVDKGNISFVLLVSNKIIVMGKFNFKKQIIYLAKQF